MVQKIKQQFMKVYNKLFRKKTRGTIYKRDRNGKIHIFGDVIIHGSITCGKPLNSYSTFTEFSQKIL